MTSKLAFYLLLKPLSLMPLWVLYLKSDALFLLLYYLIGYRKKVVHQNLQHSFPEKPVAELRRIERESYRHLCDLIAESVRMFSMPAEEAKRRCVIVERHLLDECYAAGRSVIVAASHLNNWELAMYAAPLHMKYKALGIYSPLKNSFFDQKIRQSRGRHGAVLVSKKDTPRTFAATQKELTLTVFATDQSPTHTRQVYWTRFLNQDTAVFLGTETFAAKYNMPVFFAHVRKLRRGYYEIKLTLIEDEPQKSQPGAITEQHTRLLESAIREKPSEWLWTHKRWKRQPLPGQTIPGFEEER
jgi:KDO2-lipid IV(A) lauroyltransferase